jgi:hypothetical protein
LYFVGSLYQGSGWNFKSRAFFVAAIFICFVSALWFFGTAMLGRGGDPSYVETTSPLGHLQLASEYKNLGEDDFFAYTYVWLSSYLVQGYYGFSQALGVDFDSTYGFGNSPFLMRQFEWVTGFDLSENTYQNKIREVWGGAQWHSLYSHIANDVHFFGVAVWNFLMGIYLSKIWRSFLDENNLYSKALLPLFALVVIWTPANNQVFGFLETFSAFLLMTVLWSYRVFRQRPMFNG